MLAANHKMSCTIYLYHDNVIYIYLMTSNTNVIYWSAILANMSACFFLTLNYVLEIVTEKYLSSNISGNKQNIQITMLCRLIKNYTYSVHVSEPPNKNCLKSYQTSRPHHPYMTYICMWLSIYHTPGFISCQLWDTVDNIFTCIID